MKIGLLLVLSMGSAGQTEASMPARKSLILGGPLKPVTPGDWVLRKGDAIIVAVPEFRGSETGYLVRRPSTGDVAMLSFGPSGELRPLAIAPLGRALPGGWRIGLSDSFYAGDFNGDARGDVLVQSPWGIGILTQGGPDGLKTLALYPNGTVLDGHLLGSKATWRLGETTTQPVIADFNHDGRADVLILSGWGLGILGGVYDGFGVLNSYPFGTKLVGGWTLGSRDYVVGTGDFNGDGQTDIVIQSDWGVGFLTRDAATGELTTLAAVPYGSDTGKEWTVSNNTFLRGAGDFDKDGRDDLLFNRTDGSIALLSVNGSSLKTLIVAHPGDRLGDWLLGKLDMIGWIADYNEDGKAEIVVKSNWGMGILRFQPSVIPSGPDRAFVPPALKSLAMFPNGSRIKGGWVLSASDGFNLHGRLERSTADSLLVSSGWGIGVISLAPDKTLYVPLMAAYEVPSATPPATPPTPPGQTPPSAKTFTVPVEMKGTPVFKGPIPYKATFPTLPCPGCRVTQIQTLSAGPKFIFFKAPGTSEECAKPDSKYIDVVSAGGIANLSFLYGSATPPTPLTITACTDKPVDPSGPLPSVLVKVTYLIP